jgi:hypothetical protein
MISIALIQSVAIRVIGVILVKKECVPILEPKLVVRLREF